MAYHMTSLSIIVDRREDRKWFHCLTHDSYYRSDWPYTTEHGSCTVEEEVRPRKLNSRAPAHRGRRRSKREMQK